MIRHGWNISDESFSITLCHVNIVTWFYVYFYFAHCFKVYWKCGTLIDLARDCDWTTHLFNDGLTDRKSKSTTLWILLPMFVKISKVHEKRSEFVFWYSDTKILNTKFKANVGSSFCNRISSLNYSHHTFITITLNSMIMWRTANIRLLSLSNQILRLTVSW